MTNDAALTRELLKEELDASNSYEAKADATSCPKAKEVYNDIAREEKVHTGELSQLLAKQDPDGAKAQQEGMEEVSGIVKSADLEVPGIESMVKSKREGNYSTEGFAKKSVKNKFITNNSISDVEKVVRWYNKQKRQSEKEKMREENPDRKALIDTVTHQRNARKSPITPGESRPKSSVKRKPDYDFSGKPRTKAELAEEEAENRLANKNTYFEGQRRHLDNNPKSEVRPVGDKGRTFEDYKNSLSNPDNQMNPKKVLNMNGKKIGQQKYKIEHMDSDLRRFMNDHFQDDASKAIVGNTYRIPLKITQNSDKENVIPSKAKGMVYAQAKEANDVLPLAEKSPAQRSMDAARAMLAKKKKDKKGGKGNE